MALTFGERIKHAWNAFNNKDPTFRYENVTSYHPDRFRMSRGNEKTLAASIYNRIAMDVASINIRHVKVDENGHFTENIDSTLNHCFSVEANIDQTARAFIQDLTLSLFDEGVVAIVPIDTETNTRITDSFKIHTMRVGQVLEWSPYRVQLRVYNDRTGNKEDIWKEKREVALIENPLYAVMNEPNSTLKRLVRKLALLDTIDEDIGADKLNMLIQLPYAIKTHTKEEQARMRVESIQKQLKSSPHGIAYTDATEKVIQLNRPLDNNILAEVQDLTATFYSQLGITAEILNGTADGAVMTNYYNRSVEPVISAIVDEARRKFLTKTARTQGQSLMFFRDPFKLVPVTELANIADKFTRNEIMTTNEVRQVIGMLPSDDPRADELLNKNINHPDESRQVTEKPEDQTSKEKQNN